MKTIQLHPLSLLVGLVSGVGGLLLMSQSAVTTLPTARVEVGPHPRDMVQIRGGTPYTVPPGKIFVLTGIGNEAGVVGSPQVVGLLVNGARELTVAAATNMSPSVKDVPTGFSVLWGSTIEVVEISGSQEPLKPRAWGYLSDR